MSLAPRSHDKDLCPFVVMETMETIGFGGSGLIGAKTLFQAIFLPSYLQYQYHSTINILINLLSYFSIFLSVYPSMIYRPIIQPIPIGSRRTTNPYQIEQPTLTKLASLSSPSTVGAFLSSLFLAFTASSFSKKISTSLLATSSHSVDTNCTVIQETGNA